MTVKVAFGIPTEGHTPPESFQTLRLMCFHHGVLQARSKALNEDVQFEFFDMTSGRLFTPMARERLAQRSLEMGADYLLMVDDDMVVPHDLFDRLFRHRQDVVAALAFTRNPPYLAVIYEKKDGYDKNESRYFHIVDYIRSWPRGKLVECDAVGFGAVLINTSVFKKMSPPYFMCSSGTGEDIWFCINAKNAGARVFMDTSTEIGHVGAPVIIDQSLHDSFNDPEKQKRIFGPYHKFGVFDVSHFDHLNSNESDEPEVLSL